MKELAACRAEMDDIDRQIVSLFEKRMEIAREEAAYKRHNDMDLYDAAREQDILKSRAQMVKDAALRPGAAALFAEILRLTHEEEHRALEKAEKTQRVAYSGVPGAFSESAVVAFFGEDCDRENYKTFEEVFATVAQGRVKYGVVPVENSSSGSIHDVYDLLGKYACYIVGEQLVRVEHCLLGVPGTSVEDVKTVYSHEQGFAQCPVFLGKHPGWTKIPYFNTAIAAQHVAQMGDKSGAAIASRLAAKQYGLDILVPDIHSFDGNHTRFVVVSASPASIGVPDKATLTFTARHERGSLMRALSGFSALGMNLTHIESRPLHDCNWEYRFYLDLTGNVAEEHMRVLMEALQADCETCRLLGAYTAAKEDAHA